MQPELQVHQAIQGRHRFHPRRATKSSSQQIKRCTASNATKKLNIRYSGKFLKTQSSAQNSMKGRITAASYHHGPLHWHCDVGRLANAPPPHKRIEPARFAEEGGPHWVLNDGLHRVFRYSTPPAKQFLVEGKSCVAFMIECGVIMQRWVRM